VIAVRRDALTAVVVVPIWEDCADDGVLDPP
jgi:hypothetical protein